MVAKNPNFFLSCVCCARAVPALCTHAPLVLGFGRFVSAVCACVCVLALAETWLWLCHAGPKLGETGVRDEHGLVLTHLCTYPVLQKGA